MQAPTFDRVLSALNEGMPEIVKLNQSKTIIVYNDSATIYAKSKK